MSKTNERDDADFRTPPSSPDRKPPIKTHELLRETKKILERSLRNGKEINQAAVENAVATVRIDHDPVYFDLHWWKNKISSNSNPLCYDEVLRLVAYAEKPREAEQIVQESNGNVPSANELKTTLLNSKENLQRIRQVPFCRIVRQIAKTDRQRAIRYFFVEIRRRFPAIRDFNWDEAENIVDALCQTTYEIQTNEELLPILKVLNGEQVLEYLQKLSTEKNYRNTVRNSAVFNEDDDDD